MSYKHIRSLARGIDVLNYLNTVRLAHPNEISRDLDIPRPTVHRILDALIEQDFVFRSPSAKGYRLANAVHSLGDGVMEMAWMRKIGVPAISRLSRRVVWPSDLATLCDDAMVICETTHRASSLSIDLGMIGRRREIMLSPLGRAYLSFCPAEERARLLDVLRAGTGVAAALARDDIFVQDMIAVTRERGYASCRDRSDGACASIAMPILSGERVVACINVVWVRSSMDYDDAVAACVPALLDARAEIERGIAGWSLAESGH